MDPILQAKLTDSIRRAQSLFGESVSISGVSYPALIGQQSVEIDLTDQGPREVARIRFSIAQPDLASIPVTGASVTARGRNWKVSSVEPTQTTYEITAQSPTR